MCSREDLADVDTLAHLPHPGIMTASGGRGSQTSGDYTGTHSVFRQLVIIIIMHYYYESMLLGSDDQVGRLVLI